MLDFYQEKYVYVICMLTVPIWNYSGFGKKCLIYFVDSRFAFAAVLLFTLSPSCAAFGILGTGFGESVQKMLALKAAEYFQESGKMPVLISDTFSLVLTST